MSSRPCNSQTLSWVFTQKQHSTVSVSASQLLPALSTSKSKLSTTSKRYNEDYYFNSKRNTIRPSLNGKWKFTNNHFFSSSSSTVPRSISNPITTAPICTTRKTMINNRNPSLQLVNPNNLFANTFSYISSSPSVKSLSMPPIHRTMSSTKTTHKSGILSNTTKSQIKQNKGPISLKNTSRAKASAKLAVKNSLHLPHINSNNISKKRSTNLPKKLVASSQHAAVVNPDNFNTTHFVLGGTTCDPAPAPYILAKYGEESVYTLVLLRHGESEWNHENRYTGWCDVELTKKGKQEARDAGRLLIENGIEVDHAFTSLLKRANYTTNLALNASDQMWVPVTKSWRLNERHYGALQGYNKDTAYKELGIDQELVMAMRRSYDTRPPPMMNDHEHWHGGDRRYTKLSPEQLEKSRGESLKDAAERIMPFFRTVIIPSLRAGNKCLIVSHANTLRTLIKQIDNISDEDIKGMSIPTGVPLLYRFDKNLKPVDPNEELEFRYMVEPKGYTWATSRAHGFHGVYLGDLERLQDIQRKRDVTNRDWQRIILKNLALSLDPETSSNDKGQIGNPVFETRQLWWQIHAKMHEKEFSNMLILARMKDFLEKLMYKRKQRFITYAAIEKIVDQLHLDTEGHVVEPFVKLSEIGEREKRAKQWYESMALDDEEECLIK